MNLYVKRAFCLSVLGGAAAILLAGCTGDRSGSFRAVKMASRPAQEFAMSAAGADTPRDATLAYEHSVSVELGKELLSARIRELQAACDADAKFSCTLLDVSTSNNEDVPSGSIRMRLAPAGVEVFIGMAAKDGRVADRTTHAEDLAEPVADTERQLAQLTAHRDRLAEFLKNKELKIEQVIAVSKELATVQSQLDELNTRHANLRRRIDTELLFINLSLPPQDYRAQQHPIRDALRSFGSDFLRAVAQVIGFLAALLPWLVIALPGLILLRLFWRWISRWLARREQRAA